MPPFTAPGSASRSATTCWPAALVDRAPVVASLVRLRYTGAVSSGTERLYTGCTGEGLSRMTEVNVAGDARGAAASDRDSDQLDRKPLGRQIADRVRTDIILGKLTSGRHLTQQELCFQYGTSRMPARDALLLLAYEGFVIDEGAGRVRVAPLDRRSIEDLFRIEGVLHGLACRMVSERARIEEIDELGTVSEAMTSATDDATRRAEHQRFHRLVNLYAQSSKLRSAIRPLSQQIPSDFVTIVPGWVEKAATMHREVLDAMRRRDGAGAEAIMIDHTRAAGDAYVDYLAERGALPQEGQ